MVSVVNVVASGSLGIELDLETVARELSEVVDYDPEKYPGAYFRLDDSAPLITVYRTGKYIITGADSADESSATRSEFLRLLTDQSILPKAEDEWYKIQNYVCMEDLGQQLNLSALAIGLGLEFTEYEPEQFPGLVYRPMDHDSVMLIFGSGKVIITGTTDVVSAEEAIAGLLEQIDSLF
ncbi:TATA-box-binding protein [Haloarchaeobius sp. HRN-SO-5]|uniref:TATA-box-binding protein n=1 Tax=Haloarchaeobius sp. HRN-SO-5 TaxID=3446118 RepID=UPI003EC1156D